MALAALREWKTAEPRLDPARLDPTTLLPNRRQFQSDALVWSAPRSTLVLVTLADPQDFNEILRVLGHSRSEAFVRAGATRLKELLGPGTAIYHVSHLGFAFRVPGHAEPAPPPMVRRILAGFGEPLLCDDVPIDCRIGIGLKALGEPGGSPGEDLRATLSAAQDSRAGGEGWSWFDRKSDEAHRRAFRLLSDLRTALDGEEQLSLHYQPKVSLANGKCASAEALIRWLHPELGQISPGEFVGLAEATALMTPLTRWVIDAATRQVALWAHDGLEMSVAINVSPKNLEEPDFVEYLLFCCAARGLDRARIELEVTEGVSVSRSGLVLDRLAALRGLGFSIAIDDFGSGYSNMSYLTRLSANTLKIDQSLIRGATSDGLGAQLVSSIVQMGRDLGYRMVAEGIETEAERDLLTGWGCDYGQGWHFGRPMPAKAFGEWLEGRGEAPARRAAGGR